MEPLVSSGRAAAPGELLSSAGCASRRTLRRAPPPAPVAAGRQRLHQQAIGFIATAVGWIVERIVGQQNAHEPGLRDPRLHLGTGATPGLLCAFRRVVGTAHEWPGFHMGEAHLIARSAQRANSSGGT